MTTPERARQEVSIQHALVIAGMTTPVSQTMKNGDVVGEIDGHAFTISRMIEGKHPQVVNVDLVTEFGRVLARFRNTTQQLDIAGSSWLMCKQDPERSDGGLTLPFAVPVTGHGRGARTPEGPPAELVSQCQKVWCASAASSSRSGPTTMVVRCPPANTSRQGSLRVGFSACEPVSARRLVSARA
jgi:hypothetical protein